MEEIKKNVHIYIPTSERLERSFWSFIYFSEKYNDFQFNPWLQFQEQRFSI